MSEVDIYPSNDFNIQVLLKQVDTNSASLTYGKSIPLTAGTVTFFLAVSDSPTATAADQTFTGTATHVGNGWWLVQFPGSVLTPALMAQYFASTPPILIVTQSGSHIRTVVPLVYIPSKYAQVS